MSEASESADSLSYRRLFYDAASQCDVFELAPAAAYDTALYDDIDAYPALDAYDDALPPSPPAVARQRWLHSRADAPPAHPPSALLRDARDWCASVFICSPLPPVARSLAFSWFCVSFAFWYSLCASFSRMCAFGVSMRARGACRLEARQFQADSPSEFRAALCGALFVACVGFGAFLRIVFTGGRLHAPAHI